MGLRGRQVSDLSWVVGDGWLLLVHLVQIVYCISTLYSFLLCPKLALALTLTLNILTY